MRQTEVEFPRLRPGRGTNSWDQGETEEDLEILRLRQGKLMPRRGQGQARQDKPKQLKAKAIIIIAIMFSVYWQGIMGQKFIANNARQLQKKWEK